VTLSELKKKLVAAGFEIYRTLPDSVALVERVRENLILDSGVRLALTPAGFKIRVVFRAEGRGFPGESEEQMLERAGALANQATAEGFWAVDKSVAPQMDPSSPDVELDRFYEVSCEREVPDFEDATAAMKKAFEWLRSVPAS
jgi:hypothetical protein